MRVTASVFERCFPSFETSSSTLRICTDSRQLEKGDVFFAIKGENFNGHDFLQKAIDRGALALVVDQSHSKPPDTTIPILKEADTTEAIRRLAGLHRESLQTKIFCVAGSNGKTTTKEFLAFVLEKKIGAAFVHKTQKSENSILGLALSLLRMTEHHHYAVIEVGIDEPGWMKKHLELLKPDFACITNIQEEHMAGFKSIEKVAEEELQVLEYCRRNQKAFVANLDNHFIRSAELPSRYWSFALNHSAQVEGLFSSPNILSVFGTRLACPLPGQHNAQNLLCAITSLQAIFPDSRLEDFHFIFDKLREFKNADHRSEVFFTTEDSLVYDDTYNANPGSMEAALEGFNEVASGYSKMAIIGDMLDLGEHSLNAHKRILNLLSVMDFQYIIVLGAEFHKAAANLHLPDHRFSLCHDLDEARNLIKEKRSSYQGFFLKASRGVGLERLLDLFPKIDTKSL